MRRKIIGYKPSHTNHYVVSEEEWDIIEAHSICNAIKSNLSNLGFLSDEQVEKIEKMALWL